MLSLMQPVLRGRLKQTYWHRHRAQTEGRTVDMLSCRQGTALSHQSRRCHQPPPRRPLGHSRWHLRHHLLTRTGCLRGHCRAGLGRLQPCVGGGHHGILGVELVMCQLATLCFARHPVPSNQGDMICLFRCILPTRHPRGISGCRHALPTITKASLCAEALSLLQSLSL